MSHLDANIDAVQTAAIVILTLAVVLSLWRSDVRFGRLHRDIQDAILGQYAMIKDFHAQQRQVDQHERRIDALRADLEERCAKMDKRVVVLERPARSA